MATIKLAPLGKGALVKRRMLWLCFFLCLGGAALVCVGGKPCLQAWQARGWTATACTIDDSEIDSTLRPGHAQVYKFTVSYHYTFDGQDYRSQSATFDPDAEMDLARAGSLSNRYPSEGRATCFVNPDQPSEAVLDRTVPQRYWAATLGGVVLVLASFSGLVATKRGK